MRQVLPPCHNLLSPALGRIVCSEFIAAFFHRSVQVPAISSVLGKLLGACVIFFLVAIRTAGAGDFTIGWGGTHNWSTGATGPVTYTLTDQYGFEVDATLSISRIGGAAVSGYPNDITTFGSEYSLGLAWDPSSGNSGIGESTNTAVISFTVGGSPFGVDAFSFRVSDIDATDNDNASDRCDFITATGNNGNPTLSYVSANSSTRSVRIGPATGSGSTGSIAANQAQCIYNIGGTSSNTSNNDDNGSVLVTYPSGTSTATIAYDESIENVYGVTNRDAAARGIGVWAATAVVVDTSISLAKTASVSSFGSAGETITYTYTVTNTGNLGISSSQNIVISDDKIGEFICDAGPLAIGASTQCTANYTTTSADVTAAQVTNNAVAGVGTTGQTFATRLQSGTQSVTVTYAATVPDFAISKTANKSQVSYSGETITYTISLSNVGTADLTGVSLTDALAQNGSPLTLTSGPTFVSGDTDTDSELDLDETWVWSATYSVTQAVLDDGSDIVNTATISTNETGSKNATATTSTPGTSFACAGDNWPGNLIAGVSGSTDCNTSTATGESGEPSPTNMAPLYSIWYQWTAPVNGSATFETCDTSYTNYDTYIAAYTGSSVSALTTVTSNDDGSGCANYSSRMTFDATAGVTYYIQVDGYQDKRGNFRLDWAMTPDQADLELSKTVDNATPNISDDVTFTLTLVNNGPDPATGVEVTDLLPSGLSFVSATPAQGSYNSSTGLWDVGTLASSASTTLQIVATVTGSGTITNSAEVTASGTLDSDSTAGDGTGDDYASQSLTVAAPQNVSCPTGSTGTGSGFASSGSGTYLEEVFWLDWYCGGNNFLAGNSYTKTWSLPDGITVTGVLSNINQSLRPYSTTEYGNNALDDYYGGVNPIAISNLNVGQDPSYQLSFSATKGGVSVPLEYVLADGEYTDPGSEYLQASTTGSGFELLETVGSSSVSGIGSSSATITSGGGGTSLISTQGSPTLNVSYLNNWNQAMAYGIRFRRDFSDAPTATLGGANHRIISIWRLGAAVTSESSDYNDPNAAGDADDGVTMPSMVQGMPVTIPVTVAGSGGYLQAWIDWDGDGSFGGAGEQAAADVQDGGAGDGDASANGTIELAVTVPATAVTTQTFARFRWSTSTGVASSGSAGVGEVEDYAFTVTAGTPGLSVAKVATFGAGPTTADGSTDNVATGAEITYTYTITNTGNQTITAISMADVHDGLGTDPVPDPDAATLTDNGTSGDSSNTTTGDNQWDELGPGDVLTVTATYTVTQQDVDQLQ